MVNYKSINVCWVYLGIMLSVTTIKIPTYQKLSGNNQFIETDITPPYRLYAHGCLKQIAQVFKTSDTQLLVFVETLQMYHHQDLLMLAAGALGNAGIGTSYRYYHLYNMTSMVWQERKLIHKDYMPNYATRSGANTNCVQDDKGRVSVFVISSFKCYLVHLMHFFCLQVILHVRTVEDYHRTWLYNPRTDEWTPIGGLNKDCSKFDMVFTRGKVTAIGTVIIYVFPPIMSY